MEGLFILLGIFLLLSLVVTPCLCLHLLGRVRALERKLREEEATAPRVGATPEAKAPQPEGTQTPAAPAPRSALSEAKRRSREEPAVAKDTDSPPEKTTPPTPAPVAKESAAPTTTPAKTPSGPPPLPEEALPRAHARLEKEPAPPPPEPMESWLKRLGLEPPSAEEKDSNLVAWWSTRLGLTLGVIAAVFFGMYINKNTVPWVRLLELVLVAVAIFGAGPGGSQRKAPRKVRQRLPRSCM